MRQATPVILVPYPVARKQADPLGFVVGVYDIEELVHVAINLLEPRGVEVLVRDDSAGGDAQFLHFYASRLEPRAAVKASGLMPAYDEDQPSMVVGIPVGDRQLVDHLRRHPYLS
jgi:hypothetical protein